MANPPRGPRFRADKPGKSDDLEVGSVRSQRELPQGVTGPDGRFAFPTPAGESFLIVVSDAGYADAPSGEIAKAGKLVLRPWGQIEGGVRIGPRQGTNQQVVFRPIRPEGRVGISRFAYVYRTWTDERGRFRFDRVVPGSGTVVRVVGKMYTGGLIKAAAVLAGDRRDRAGRDVPGDDRRQRPAGGGPGRPGWNARIAGRLDSERVGDARRGTTCRPGQARMGMIRFSSILFASTIEKDGRFRIEDVPAGEYELELSVNGSRTSDSRVRANRSAI